MEKVPMTNKPCHGCGKQGWRSATAVCERCQQLINEANARRALLEDEAEAAVMPGASNDLPHIGNAGNPFRPELDHLTRFQEAILRLAQLVSERGSPNRVLRTHGPEPSLIRGTATCYRSGGLAWFRAGVVEQLRAVYAAAAAMVEYGYQDGKRDGQGLLMGLAGGDVSLEQYNEKTVGRLDPLRDRDVLPPATQRRIRDAVSRQDGAGSRD